MSTLRASIEALANQFATGVLAAIRGASLEEILSEGGSTRRGPGRPRRSVNSGSATQSPAATRAPRARGGKRLRRNAKDIAAAAQQIAAHVAKHPKGIRGEQVRKDLGIAKNHWLKPLGIALASKKIRKTGEKRATAYFPAR
jgi:hypothetical protein